MKRTPEDSRRTTGLLLRRECCWTANAALPKCRAPVRNDCWFMGLESTWRERLKNEHVRIILDKCGGVIGTKANEIDNKGYRRQKSVPMKTFVNVYICGVHVISLH